MKCLFLDLASHEALIAAVSSDCMEASESVHARIGDHELIPMIEKVLSDAGWSYKDLDRIVCIIGPGGFTSLRVAVTCANTLADQLEIPSVGIHLSELYWVRIQGNRGTGEHVYWLHSTKKDQLFVRGGTWEEPTLISVQDLPVAESHGSPLRWCGELIDEHREIVAIDPVDLAPVTEVLPEFLSSQTFDSELLHPWYGRGW